MSIRSDPPCTPGEILDLSSVRFKAQEKFFCDQVSNYSCRFLTSVTTILDPVNSYEK